MALDLSRILGLGADQPLVDLENDFGAAARAPGPIAPPAGAGTPLPSFATDTILGLAPERPPGFRRSLGGGLSAAANDDKPEMASLGGALGGTSQDLQVATLDRAI